MVGSTAISEMQAVWNLQFQYVSIIVRLKICSTYNVIDIDLAHYGNVVIPLKMAH